MSSWARYFVLGCKSRSTPLVNVVDLEGKLQTLARTETGFSWCHSTAMACRYDSQWRWQSGSTQAWNQPDQGAPYCLRSQLCPSPAVDNPVFGAVCSYTPALSSTLSCLQVESWLAKAFSKALQPSAVAININSPGLDLMHR